MPPIVLIIGGFILLGVFAFGGKVQGRGEPSYIASAARAFVGPWLFIVFGNLWVRWSAGQSLVAEALWLVPAILLPVASAFLVWRTFTRKGAGGE